MYVKYRFRPGCDQMMPIRSHYWSGISAGGGCHDLRCSFADPASAQFARHRQRYAALTRATYCDQSQEFIPKIEMVLGSWYLDEFGNPTRELKAHESAFSVCVPNEESAL